MSLSNQVKESVTQAAGNLREALAFAARTEHPVVISSLTDVLDAAGIPRACRRNYGKVWHP
jgi:hypothetical protein